MLSFDIAAVRVILVTFLLEQRADGVEGEHDCDEFGFLPLDALFLAFPVDHFEVGVVVHVLRDDAKTIRRVLRFREVVAVEANDVRAVLDFRELHCFFFVFVELIKCFRFDFFQRVDLTRLYVLHFEDLRVLLP